MDILYVLQVYIIFIHNTTLNFYPWTFCMQEAGAQEDQYGIVSIMYT